MALYLVLLQKKVLGEKILDTFIQISKELKWKLDREVKEIDGKVYFLYSIVRVSKGAITSMRLYAGIEMNGIHQNSKYQTLFLVWHETLSNRESVDARIILNTLKSKLKS